MNETVTTIIWCFVGGMAFLELSRLYYRIYVLEQTMNKCVDVVEQIAMGIAKSRTK